MRNDGLCFHVFDLSWQKVFFLTTYEINYKSLMEILDGSDTTR